MCLGVVAVVGFAFRFRVAIRLLGLGCRSAVTLILCWWFYMT